MVSYKKIDLIVDTFSNELKDKKLLVIGDELTEKKLKKLQKSNVTF